MQSLGTKVGVAVAILGTVLLIIPMIKLLLGDCYFEQGCEPYENFKVIAALMSAAGVGMFVGWLTYKLINLVKKARPISNDRSFSDSSDQ